MKVIITLMFVLVLSCNDNSSDPTRNQYEGKLGTNGELRKNTMSDIPFKKVKKTSFVLPTIPKKLGIDPILLSLLHSAAFLMLSEDEEVDPDGAVEAMEHVGAYLQRMGPASLQNTQRSLDKIADYGYKSGWNNETVEFIREFLRNSGAVDE